MSSYNHKLIVDAIKSSSLNHKEESEWMAKKCRYGVSCTIGYLTCPFSDKSCEDITAEDWMKVLTSSTETSNEQD